MKKLAFSIFFFCIVLPYSFGQEKRNYSIGDANSCTKISEGFYSLNNPTIHLDNQISLVDCKDKGLSVEDFCELWKSHFEPKLRFPNQYKQFEKLDKYYYIGHIEPPREGFTRGNASIYMILKKEVNNILPTSPLNVYVLQRLKNENYLDKFLLEHVKQLSDMNAIGIFYPDIHNNSNFQLIINKFEPTSSEVAFLQRNGMCLSDKQIAISLLSKAQNKKKQEVYNEFMTLREAFVKASDFESYEGSSARIKLLFMFDKVFDAYIPKNYTKIELKNTSDSVKKMLALCITNENRLELFYELFLKNEENKGFGLLSQIEKHAVWDNIKSWKVFGFQNTLDFQMLNGAEYTASIAKAKEVQRQSSSSKNPYDDVKLGDIFNAVDKVVQPIANAVEQPLGKVIAAADNVTGGALSDAISNSNPSSNTSGGTNISAFYQIISSTNAEIRITKSQNSDWFNIYSKENEKKSNENYYSSITDNLNQKKEFKDSYDDNNFKAYGNSINYPMTIFISYMSNEGKRVSATIKTNIGIEIEITQKK